jgi:hypothetical protein
MNRRILASVAATAVVIAAAAMSFGCRSRTPPETKSTAATKTWTLSKTADGQPDLQGTWNWASLTPLERRPELAGKAFLTEEEAAEIEGKHARLRGRPNPRNFDEIDEIAKQEGDAEVQSPRDGVGASLGAHSLFAYERRIFYDDGRKVVSTRRTSLVIDPPDGRIPALIPEARKRVAAAAEYKKLHGFDGPEGRPLHERCIMPANSPPFSSYAQNNIVQIFQTPGYVMLLTEMVHTVRVIPLDGRPYGNIRQWLGVSRGRWEGNTLIVETRNFKTAGPNFHGASENLELVERFTRAADDTLIYEYTMNDPTTWTKPWTAQLSLTKEQGPRAVIYEYACHEGNHAMEGMLSAARADERAGRVPTDNPTRDDAPKE